MDLITSSKDRISLVISDEEYKKLYHNNNECDKKCNIKCNIKKNDWEYQALITFIQCHKLRNIWLYLSPDQKIKESHAYYDRVFRSPRRCNYVVEEIYNAKSNNSRLGNPTHDHPFNARSVMRIIMEDWPEFMDNFEDYKKQFYKLLETLGTTKKQNQDVKVKPDKKGGIIIPQLIKDRYAEFVFVNVDTHAKVIGFPLEIPEWYYKGELKRLMK